MRVLLVQRLLPGVAPEDLLKAEDPAQLCQPVAVICVAHEISDEEMNAMGNDVLKSIGDKPVDSNKVLLAYSMLASLG